jgi:hypothetical protein
MHRSTLHLLVRWLTKLLAPTVLDAITNVVAGALDHDLNLRRLGLIHA